MTELICACGHHQDEHDDGDWSCSVAGCSCIYFEDESGVSDE